MGMSDLKVFIIGILGFIFTLKGKAKVDFRYQPSGAGGTRSPPATPYRLQNPKWPPGGPKMADRVWKGVYPWVFGHSPQLLQKKFFDPRSRSMRKGCDREWD